MRAGWASTARTTCSAAWCPTPSSATRPSPTRWCDPDAAAPAGWSREFASCVREVVLPGFSAYSVEDGREAGRRLLEQGAVRVKDAGGVGGGGQEVITTAEELDAHLETLDPEALARQGMVLERNLGKVTTHSIGQVRVGGLTAPTSAPSA